MDTGAARTVLSSRVYEAMSEGRRPKLVKSGNLRGADGSPITELGKAGFHMKLGPYELEHEVVVDIEDEALLGFDVLMGGKNGPADLLLSIGVIVLDGVEIPCRHVGVGKGPRKVTVADDVLLPGRTETIVDVYVERQTLDDLARDSEFLVEPSEGFKERYNLVMASTLVDINNGPTCKVRVLNHFPVDVTLKQDAHVGAAERIVRIVSVLAEKEHVCEDGNLSRVRRVTCRDRAGPSAVLKEVKPGVGGVPAHLQGLYEKAAGGKSEYEKGRVAELLAKHGDIFSKDEWDIGLTDVAEHAIDTGDAAKIKQRPRRVPLAFAAEKKSAIEDLLKKGVIQKSTSPWASPIVFVRKKSGTVRPCVDYRKVNVLVKQDGFPLPRVQDCLDAVAGMTLFSSFDLTSRYFQIPLKKDDVPKTCKYGLFKMTGCPLD
ncbi:uncharacterized protein LOC123546249 [Mercenaria mercenaria]|uniref:uncharacterized protein LOC123546249 n=1 Tax=Mercenaria mercenaria TaxID=6596 RepID=UPI001E1D65CC|nr:uncharacterized protein LOC123546249 [Mercenaria mercenaria]